MDSVGALVLRCVAAGPSEGGGWPGARRGVQADGSDSDDPGWARLPGPDAGSIAPPAGYSLRDGDAVAAAPRPAQGVCRGGPSLTPAGRSCWTASSTRPAGPSSHALSLSRYCRCRAQETCRHRGGGHSSRPACGRQGLRPRVQNAVPGSLRTCLRRASVRAGESLAPRPRVLGGRQHPQPTLVGEAAPKGCAGCAPRLLAAIRHGPGAPACAARGPPARVFSGRGRGPGRGRRL